ncbi:MAG: hypothetical protein ACK56I_06905, partial [bacterium]
MEGLQVGLGEGGFALRGPAGGGVEVVAAVVVRGRGVVAIPDAEAVGVFGDGGAAQIFGRHGAVLRPAGGVELRSFDERDAEGGGGGAHFAGEDERDGLLTTHGDECGLMRMEDAIDAPAGGGERDGGEGSGIEEADRVGIHAEALSRQQRGDAVMRTHGDARRSERCGSGGL